MKKILVAQYEKCTGCRACEIVCAFVHSTTFNPSKAGIQIVKQEDLGIDVPVVCSQCEDAPCMMVCVVEAMHREPVSGAILINHDRCIGCKICIVACPYGCITLDRQSGKMLKCDLCGGRPECVRYCTTGAIEFREPAKIVMAKRIAFAKKASLTP